MEAGRGLRLAPKVIIRDVFWFDFRDVEVRDVYLDDEVHQAIGARIVAELDGGTDGVFVFDYEL